MLKLKKEESYLLIATIPFSKKRMVLHQLELFSLYTEKQRGLLQNGCTTLFKKLSLTRFMRKWLIQYHRISCKNIISRHFKLRLCGFIFPTKNLILFRHENDLRLRKFFIFKSIELKRKKYIVKKSPTKFL